MTLLDDTPAAITALSGAKLQEAGYSGIADVVNLVPNTSLTSGTHGNTQIFIRGIGDVFLLAGGDPGVALYTDGAYISDQTSSGLALFDLQRVEVLRGPQGALYGRNATGGAMNLITSLPTPGFRASANVVFGNYGRKDSEGFVSGPVGGSATSVRLSYQLQNLDGWTSNPLAGVASGPVIPPGPATVGPGRLDDLDSRAVRLQSLTQLGGDSTLRLVASHARRAEAGSSVPLLVDPVMIPGLLAGAVPSSDPRTVKSQESTNRVEVSHLLANCAMRLGGKTLKLLASWRKSSAARSFDADGTEALITGNRFDTSSTDKSIDVHLTSADGVPFQWLVGATALRFDQRQDVVVSSQVPIGFLVPGALFTVPLPGGVAFAAGRQRPHPLRSGLWRLQVLDIAEACAARRDSREPRHTSRRMSTWTSPPSGSPAPTHSTRPGPACRRASASSTSIEQGLAHLRAGLVARLQVGRRQPRRAATRDGRSPRT